MGESGTTPITWVNITSVTDTASMQTGANETEAFPEDETFNLLWLIFCPVVVVLGCFGNVMTIVVMRRVRSSQATACLSVYFTALAVSDLLFFWSLIVWYWFPVALDIDVLHLHDMTCAGIVFLVYTLSETSAWFLVSMTFQRLVSVLMPHRVVVLCTVRTGKIVTAIIVTVASAVNIHVFFHYRVEKFENNTFSCVSQYKLVVSFFAFLDLVVASILPFLFLTVANSILIYRTRQAIWAAGQMAGKDQQQTSSRSAKVSSMTTTLMATSAVFLALTLPTCIIDVYLEEVGYYDNEVDDPEMLNYLVFLDSVGMVLFICNSTVNFYIYILTGSKFRQEAKQVLCKVFNLCSKPDYTV